MNDDMIIRARYRSSWRLAWTDAATGNQEGDTRMATVPIAPTTSETIPTLIADTRRSLRIRRDGGKGNQEAFAQAIFAATDSVAS